MAVSSLKKPYRTESSLENDANQKKKKNGINEKKFFECCASKSNTKDKGIPPQKQTQKGTKIVVKFDCGFQNALFIRGEGLNGLSWDKGIPMKNVKTDEWVWETKVSFRKAQFKVLINDKQFEVGENHTVECGNSMKISPNFNTTDPC